MSTVRDSTSSAVPPRPGPQREIKIYSHSDLFYWWPVWAVGFLMTIWTAIDGYRMAIVPPHSEARTNLVVVNDKGEQEVREGILVPGAAHLPTRKVDDKTELLQPKFFMTQSKNPGVVFSVVLLIIILVTNARLRGLWSVLLVAAILILVLLFALFDVWDTILEKFKFLSIYINLGGYVFLSLVLFAMWALTVFVFDHRHYIVVSPQQVRVCLAIGAGETVYNASGMTFTKRQDDFFRHWIVGMGSGDLHLVQTQTNKEIDLQNVLFVGAKVKEIERLLKEVEVV